MMAAVMFFGGGLVLAIVIKIAWINLTPGQYVKYGCCGYGYLTEEQIQVERKKINLCELRVCTIGEEPGYKMHVFFNNLDFNK